MWMTKTRADSSSTSQDLFTVRAAVFWRLLYCSCGEAAGIGIPTESEPALLSVCLNPSELADLCSMRILVPRADPGEKALS